MQVALEAIRSRARLLGRHATRHSKHPSILKYRLGSNGYGD